MLLMGRGNPENYSLGKCLFAWQQPHLPHSQTISGTLQALLLFCSFVSAALLCLCGYSMWLYI